MSNSLELELWKKLEEISDIDMSNDIQSFSDSEEMNILMQQYQDSLILKLSGVINDLPDWLGSEKTHGT
jgi:hypothetical protein